MLIPEPKTDNSGFKYYEELPPLTRVATINDFINIKECVKKQKPFLIHSWHTNKYECHRVKTEFFLQKIKPWLDEGRIFVFEEIK
jgi:hypothetical protein